MSEGLSLNDYAALPKSQGPVPWIESLPEWLEILEAYKSGVKLYQIRAWLISERKYPATEATRSRVARLSRNYSDG